MIAVKTCKQEDIKVEPMKRGPVGLRQALWDDLKKMSAPQ